MPPDPTGSARSSRSGRKRPTSAMPPKEHTTSATAATPSTAPAKATRGRKVAPKGETTAKAAVGYYRLLNEEVELSISTRESPAFRDHVVKLGITSISAGSKTNPGGYAVAPESLEQFEISDERSPAEIAAMLRRQGYEPVWKDWDNALMSPAS